MSLLELPVDQINESRLRELITAQVSENNFNEYKRSLAISNDAEKRELLKDASAFANARGGHIIFGMVANEGIPTELVPLPGDLDASILGMESTIRDAIQPRILGIQTIPVPLAAGGRVIVLRIPQSVNVPHRVSYQGLNRYYVRNSAGTHEASVDELRELFMQGRSTLERTAIWSDARVNLIHNTRGPVRLRGGGRLIVHLIPLADAPASPIAIERANATLKFTPMGADNYRADYNVDGIIFTRLVMENGYTQVFRTGALEATYTDIIFPAQYDENRPTISARKVYDLFFEAVPRFVRGLSEIGGQFPIICHVKLQGVTGAYVQTDEVNRHSLYEDLSLPSAIVDSAASASARAPFRLMFDALWNAGAAERCPLF